MPKVSVILPNYNHEKFIENRIESILNQDFQDFELIILDDASSDNSVSCIKKYLDDDRIIEFILNNNNSGSTFAQWEKGLNIAQGEYIWIAESDDIAKHNFLGEMVKILDKKNDIGLAFCPSTWIDENGKTIHEPDHESEDQTWEGSQLVVNEFLIGNLIYNASSAVFRKTLLKKANFTIIKNFKYSGDWMFWVQVLAKTNITRISKRLNQFRRHKNNVSTISERDGLQFIEGIKITKYIFKNYKVGFLKRRTTMLFWTKKFINSNQPNKKEVLAKLPFEIKFWYAILSKL